MWEFGDKNKSIVVKLCRFNKKGEIKMRVIHKVLSTLTIPISIAGIIFYYATDLMQVVYICAGLDILHSFLNCIYGGQNNLMTELYTFIIGAAVALIFKIDFLPCIAVAFCYAELFFIISSWIALLLLTHERKK